MTVSDDDVDFGERYWRTVSTSADAPHELSAASLDDSAFRILADNIPTLCWLANGDGYIVWYNRRWHEYCGTTPEQMEGWGWQSVHDPEILPKVAENWARSIAEGSPFEMTFPLKGADGRFRPFLTRIQPMRAPDGTIIRWFGVNTNISRQVATNEALEASQASLRNLNDRLEQLVAERTATLERAQQELRATNLNLESRVEARVAELKAANEEIQRFAYIVSHDLRAPLVNVLGFTSELDALRGDLGDFLKDVAARAPDLVTPDRRMAVETDLPEALGFIRSSTQKMDRLISAILKLSREGRRQLNPEPIDLVALVGMQRQSLAQQLAAREATLVVEGPLPPVISDKLALEQVFGNLIENAVKYLSPDRAGRVLVSGREDGPWLVYDIVDNGRGIAAQDFERVFELFRRSGEQDTQGEGIGLAYVRNLSRRLGGNVTLRSVLGEGSTFSVTLPADFQVPS